MRSKRLFSLFLAPALLLPGCSTTPKVQTQAKTGADYTNYHTFALMPLTVPGPASDPGLMLRLAQPARQVVVETLTAKGFTETNHTQADLAVNLRGESLPRMAVTDWGYQPLPIYGPRGYYGMNAYRDVDVRPYEERTLSLELFDNRTKELVWVGWSKSEARGEIPVEKMQETIRRILLEFPPGTAPTNHESRN